MSIKFVINRKPFIEVDSVDNERLDLTYKKIKCRSFKMALTPSEAEEIEEDLAKATNLDSGFNDLSDEQKRAIITLIVSKYC